MMLRLSEWSRVPSCLGHERTGRGVVAGRPSVVGDRRSCPRATRRGVVLLRSSWQAAACVVRAERRGLGFGRAGTGGVSRALVTLVPAVDKPACRGGSSDALAPRVLLVFGSR